MVREEEGKIILNKLVKIKLVIMKNLVGVSKFKKKIEYLI